MTLPEVKGLAAWPEGALGFLSEEWFEIREYFLSRELLVMRMRSLQDYLDSAEDVIERPAEQRTWVECLIQGYRGQAEQHRHWQGEVSITPPPLDRGEFYRLKQQERAQFLDQTAGLLEQGLAKEGALPLILRCRETWTQHLEFFSAKLAQLDGDVETMADSRARIEEIIVEWSGRFDVYSKRKSNSDVSTSDQKW